MPNTEWWQRGSIDGIPAVLQPVAYILLQVRESVGEIVEPLTEQEWNARPAGVASAAFHVRHIAGVIDRLFTYARGNALSALATYFTARAAEGSLDWHQFDERTNQFLRDKLIALDRVKAEFCYHGCRALRARRVVEAGTSFGVSTLFLHRPLRVRVRSAQWAADHDLVLRGRHRVHGPYSLMREPGPSAAPSSLL
jgi:hypothetical protein